MGKALVLSSGGVDSTTCLGLAIEKYGRGNVISISLYYGQKHDKELESAKKVAKYYGIKHIEEDISNIMKYASNTCSLIKGGNEIIHGSYGKQKEKQERISTYVPFRNGLLLSIATSYADSIFPNEEVEIYYGAHIDDASGAVYADCSEEFADAINRAISIGTYGRISVNRPLINMNKSKVVRTGLEINVPYELTWSCYEGKEKACGKCATCIDRLKAFKDNGIKDPIQYG